MTTKLKECDYCEGTGSCCTNCGETDDYCCCPNRERDIRKCHTCKGTGNESNA